MLTIGLTGGIASGKSLASQFFAERGAAVVDLDLIAREVVAPGEPLLAAVFERFGNDLKLPDGTLNRRALRTLIFSQPAERTALEALMHPAIRSRLQHRLDSIKLENSAPYIIVAIPLLAASRDAYVLDAVIVVDCDEPLQCERLMRRDHHTLEEAQTIIRAQPSRESRLHIADYVLHNAESPDQLAAQVQTLDQRFRAPSPG